MTLKVMSRPGRITLAGHIMTIVRNILGEEAANGVGKIRMLKENGEEVCLHPATTPSILWPILCTLFLPYLP